MAKIIIALFLFIPSLVFGAFGDKDIIYQQAVPSHFSTTGTTYMPLEYHCVDGEEMTSLSFFTRSSTGSRTLSMIVASSTVATTTISTTPALAVFSGFSIPCSGGLIGIDFTISAGNFYVYGFQGDSAGDYKLLNTSGTIYNFVHRATFVLPLTSGSGGGGGGGSNIYVGDTISGMVSEWECTTSGDTTNCEAIATSSIGMYNGPNFQEWLFVGGVIIFLLSFMFWGRISWTNKA